MRRQMHFAIRNLANRDDLRYASLYSLLLAATCWMFWWWPIDREHIYLMVYNPWLQALQKSAITSTLILSFTLGFLALVRRNWMSRVLALAALALAIEATNTWFGYNIGLGLVGDLLYTLNSLWMTPVGAIWNASGQSYGTSSMALFAGLAVAAVLVRPLYLGGCRRVQKHWPIVETHAPWIKALHL